MIAKFSIQGVQYDIETSITGNELVELIKECVG